MIILFIIIIAYVCIVALISYSIFNTKNRMELFNNYFYEPKTGDIYADSDDEPYGMHPFPPKQDKIITWYYGYLNGFIPPIDPRYKKYKISHWMPSV